MALDLVRAAARQNRHVLGIGREPDSLANGVAAQVLVLDRGMADEVRIGAERPPELLLERQDHRHSIARAADPRPATGAPRPNWGWPVPEHARPELSEPRSEQRIELGESHQ